MPATGTSQHQIEPPPDYRPKHTEWSFYGGNGMRFLLAVEMTPGQGNPLGRCCTFAGRARSYDQNHG